MSDPVVDPAADAAEPVVAAEKKPDDVRRIKIANKTLQRERDEYKAKFEKFEKEAQDAKLSEVEKFQKLVKAKEEEAATAIAEASAAKKERDFERNVSRLIAKHSLADPDYGDLVLRGYNPEEHDLDAYVAEVKKKPSIARLFKTENSRILDEDGTEIVPKTAGNTGKVSKGSNWEDNERSIAESLYPNNKPKQDSYIAGLKKLRAEGGK